MSILSFYEPLADHYHLIFEDWNQSIERQARTLAPLLQPSTPDSSRHPLKILDCACGIGTQAIGFASLGHRVVASDISKAAVDRARREAALRNQPISFFVSDMTSLAEVADHDFDVVVAIDNALSHLTVPQLVQALSALRSKLKPNGLFLASIRDYDALILQRPSMQPPAFYGEAPKRRIVHQLWDWIAPDRYIVHLYITTQSHETWQTRHFVSEYRCLLRDELSAVLVSTGYSDLRWLTPTESGFYQPIVLARRLD